MSQTLAPAFVSSDSLLTDRLVDLIYRWRKILLLVALGLYVAGFNGQWRVEPDAALYLTLGRNLATGRGYTYLWKSHHLAYPGLPYLLAGTFKIFPDQVWPGDLLILLMALASLGLVYRLFLLHAGPKMAMFMLLGVALTKTFYRYGYEIRSDMPFLLGTMAFLCGYEATFARHHVDDHPMRQPKWFDWTLLVVGLVLATITRPTIWVLVLALLVTALLAAKRGNARWRTIIVAIAVAGVAVLTFHALDPRHAALGTDDYETFAIRAVTTNWKQTVAHILTVNLRDTLFLATPDALMQVRMGWLNVALSLAFIAAGVALVRVHVLWGVFIALVVLMNIGFLALDRYYLPVIPLMLYGWWLAICALERWLQPRVGAMATTAAVGALLALGVVSNVGKIGGIIIEQQSRPFLDHYSKGEFRVLPALAEVIHQNVRANGLVLMQHPYGRIETFMSDRNVADYRDFADVDLRNHPVYVVEPMDEQTEKLLMRYRMTSSAEIAGVRRANGTDIWTLHAAVKKLSP